MSREEGGGRPLAAVVVRNTASHDARILRCARTLRSIGYEPVVIAVTSEEDRAERVEIADVPVIRLTPRPPRALQAVRAVAQGIASSLRPRKSPEGLEATESRSGPADCGAGDRLQSADPVPAGGSVAGHGLPATPAVHAETRQGGERGVLARWYRLLGTLDFYRRGMGAMLALRPAVVHCNDYNTMWIGLGAKLVAGSALIYDSHELWPDRNGRREARWWLLPCEALFVRVADRLVATSPGHAETIGRRYRVEPPRVVRNIPERQVRVDGRKLATRELTIAYVGAVTSHRGLEQAIEALAYAPAMDLRIVGPGSPSHRDRLLALASERGVSGRLRLEAPVAPQQVVDAIADAAAGLALIQPACLSYTLSLPNKLFEYLHAGLPVLASDLPVLGAFVQEQGVGLTVSPGDPVRLGQAMLEITEPERNSDLRQSVATVAGKLSWEREAERLIRVYREAVGGVPAS